MDFYLTRKLLQALEDVGVRYIIGGGVALNLHGLPRATQDIDLFVGLRRHGIPRQALPAATDPAISRASHVFPIFGPPLMTLTAWYVQRCSISQVSHRGPSLQAPKRVRRAAAQCDPSPKRLVQPVVLSARKSTTEVRRRRSTSN